jgi:AraC-like DNA-binding protein
MPVPIDGIVRFADAIAIEVGDRHLGLTLARAMPRGTYGVLEFAMRSAATVHEALTRLVRFQRSVNELVDIRLVPGEGSSIVSERFLGLPHGVGKHANEYALAVVITILRTASGAAIPARRVWLAHPSDEDHTELARFFGTENIEHGAGHNAVELSDEVLATPISSADPSLLALMDRVAPLVAPTRSEEEDTVARIKEMMGATLDALPALAEIAKRLGTSERSLQRTLADRNTSYERLVEDARRDRVMHYLAQPAYTLEQIATLAGYSGSRALSRAFRRWTGMTPAEWRRKQH